MQQLQRFTGGSVSVRNKLNEMVDVLNQIMRVRGDLFIKAEVGRAGLSIGLILDKLLPYIPKKVGGGGGGLELTWAEVVTTISYEGSSSYKLRLIDDTTSEWEETSADYAVDAIVLGSDNLKYTCIVSSGSGLSDPVSDGGVHWTLEDEITVSKPIGNEGNASSDLRNYDNWLAEGSVVPIIEVDSEWYILLAMQYVGSSPRSLSWNETDGRIMAVWA